MPGFREHITGSAIVGVAYGATGWYVGGLPPLTCTLAAGLCTAAGMMPDLDSDSGRPLQESVGFLAAIVPVLLLPRVHHWSLSLEAMIIAGGAIYLAIRFGLSWLLNTYSVHRGMFHSVPAAAIAGAAVFLAFNSQEPMHRYFVAGSAVLGYLTHLVLDEIWSVRLGLFGPKVKKSFGTAMKFHGGEAWANIVTYLLLVVLGAVVAYDASKSEQKSVVRQQVEQATRMYQPQPAPWQYRR
ncbi:MAG: metal-dependent hydrolase [Planctomycetia bacterium]